MIGDQTLLALAVAAGFGIVCPLVLGSWPRWAAAGAAGGLAVLVDPGGLAVGLAVPAAVASASALRSFRLPAVWAAVAAGALVAGRAGLELFGIGEPIVTLTAVHFAFAGVGATGLALASGRRAAVVLTTVAPPIVAVGFVGRLAVAQVGGAVVMAAGVWVTGWSEVVDGMQGRVAGVRRWCLVVSGVTVLAPMVLAVSWAAGQWIDVPALSIPAMIRWHGVPNAIGFVLLGLAGRR